MDLQQEIISIVTPQGLFDQQMLYSLYDVEDDLERERLKAILMAKSKELKLEKELSVVIKAFDEADKKLADEYTRNYAKSSMDIPLKIDGRGKPLSTIDNFLLILRKDNHFSDLRFNLLTYSPETVENAEVRRWTDADDSATRYYIENKYRIHSQPKLDDALRIVFHEREYHPIKQIIEAVKWDGVERIPNFLIKWLKCDDSDYSREVSRLIFSGGINRLYKPGCKFDDMAVLIGTRQGEGKSTFVRWLALKDDFFREVNEFEGQKGIEAIEGGWICEVSELLALTKVKEQEAVKSYLTRLNDTYRKPFDKRVTEHKRQCIFIGTTNKEQFLTDKTGNRRFYPIKVKQNGYELFEHKDEICAEILQCWAEAKAKLDKGKMKPYADRKLLNEIRARQDEAVEDDYREGMIAAYLSARDKVCIIELWQNALGNSYSKPTKKDSNDIALILQATGEWERNTKAERYLHYGSQKVWTKTHITEPEIDKFVDDFTPFQ